jgi:ABC-type multidrug transport system ATPase subunit/pSer/pThr/pTyr-binding forkhead associated (FHA) protein
MNQQDDQKVSEKAYLLGLAGKLAGRKLFIDGERVVIGRDASQCQIVLEHVVISRRHALIETDGQGRARLSSLSLKQPVLLNGQPTAQHELRDGDRIGFGPEGIISFLYHAPKPGPGYARSAGRAPAPRVFREVSPAPRAATEESFSSRPKAHAPASATVVLRAANLPVLRLGRAPDNDIVLNAPGVSRYHATLAYNGKAQPVLTDLSSTNGTFINGEPLVEPRYLTPRDIISLGGFLLHIEGRNIRRYDLSASRITARRISKEIAGKTILKDISLAIYPREFVGLMGPSGCGKSTLMNALNGLHPASAGSVHVNDLDLYRNFDALRRSIGFVPQRDILHDPLTVERTLYYAAKLRMPEAMSAQGTWKVVGEVIGIVGLSEHRTTPFRQLSGGQQKRLSLALELITKPSFIFLDEPTSPLDPETTENMMLLFRQLADEGRIVVMVTHKFEKFDEMHQIAMLTRGGRLAFFGPPREALEYFNCREPGEIYHRISERDPEELSRSYQASKEFRHYIESRLAETEKMTRSVEAIRLGTGDEQAKADRPFSLRQWLTLTQRYLEIKLKDKRNTLLLLAQAPIVAIILAIIAGQTVNDAKTLFIAAIISIWFGANNAVREIVAEAPIYERERLVNLKIPSYIFSKFFVLSGIGLLQCLLFTGILVGMGRLAKGDLISVTLILYLTLLAGVAMGLFISALVNSTEKAMSILPLILIPQLLLSGFLKPLDDLYINARTGKPATVAEYQRFEKAKDQKPDSSAPVDPVSIPDPVTKFDGLGEARYAGALMVARWSIDALAHRVSIHDEKAREKLPTQMTVAEYRPPVESRTSRIITAYRRRVLKDSIVLIGFNAIFLMLAMWALKRKDVL